jgi:alpha-N-arabinofuranosidase
MRFDPTLDGEEAGLCLIQKDDNYLLFDVKREDKENVLQLVINDKKKNPIIKKDLVMGKKYKNYIELKVVAKDNTYQYYFRYQSNDLWELFDNYKIAIYYFLKGILEPTLGLYATSNGTKSINFAAFDVFKLEYSSPPLKLKK